MSFVAAMKDYFGLLPGQNNAQFLGELKKLTLDDKAWFAAELPSVGYQIETALAA
jgi:hypothetical protein